MKSKSFKNFIAVIVILFALALIYLSSYLPFKKASLYISALYKQAQSKDLDGFLKIIDEALKFWSPVGQPEMIKFFSNNLISALKSQQEKGRLTQAEVKRVVDYTISILDSNPPGMRGLNYSQNLLIKATTLLFYAQEYNDNEYLKKAEEVLKEGLRVSPRRPQFLYGLLAVYMRENNKEGIKDVASKILTYWPQDVRVKALLESLEEESK